MKATASERSLAWLRLAVVLAAGIPLAFFCGIAWLAYGDSTQAAQRRLEDIARSAEEHAAGVMARNDLVMQQMLQLLKDDDEAGVRAREGQLHAVAKAILLRFPDIRSLSVWSRDGQLLVSTLFFPLPRALESADWEYFRSGDAASTTGSLTRGLFADGTTGEPLLRMAKPRKLGSGAAAGLVELTFSPSAFNEFQRRLTDDDKRVSIVLMNGQGSILGRWPPAPRSEARLPEAFAPGDTRFAAFRSVGDYPLFVGAVQDADAVFAGWKRDMLMLGAILFPVTLALVLASWLVLRRTRREMETRRRLLKEAEQRLLAEEALRHAQKLDALGQLAGGLAHDFNNLLTVVTNGAELLARAVPQAASRPEIAAILRAADRGARLTRRLLRFSRRQALRPEVLQPRGVLDGVFELLRTTATAGIAIDVQVDDDVPPIEADAAELEIALINLVANARDAMSNGGRIRIHARRARPGEGPDGHPLGYVVISVADSGEGMDAETLKRVFEPFFTTKAAGSGTGLGLSQVYGFCTQARGTVQIASELHLGTTVSMFLPVAAVQARPAAAPRPALTAQVLVVEADPARSSALASVLEDCGCVVTAAASAFEAERIVLAGRTHFDAVLAADAPALAGRLRQRKPDLPVVPMSEDDETPEAIVEALSQAISAHRPSAPMH